MSSTTNNRGDLNNNSVLRKPVQEFLPDPVWAHRSLAVPEKHDDGDVRAQYRPFLLTQDVANEDWISKLELSTAVRMASSEFERTGERLKILVLYGSMRGRSYSQLLSYEGSRILWRLGCDVRVYNPSGLPIKDDVQHDHPKVQELRELSKWSDGHVWVCPEQHGTITAVFKNQIDWIPLSTGSVRPTQGRTLAIAQVNGGSQSFNTVNQLRQLGRWMRMFTIPNQSSVPTAYKQFTDAVDQNDENVYRQAEGGSRMMPSGNRDRLVDCMEELVKYTILMRQHFDLFNDRFSEREDKRRKEEEARKKAEESDSVNGVNVKSM
ncbi:arsenate resistance ArsH [Hortaea werneckii]|nr:arsenate resistance ArsH [Hortaea werneckii]KAI7020848.1 arsenate resistance ArsH [Hortaea werneckii]KAI7662655.1 arsenate resistance ArsH [Hortaea werneckii]